MKHEVRPYTENFGNANLLKLACVNCGAPLEIGADLDVFACGFCGSQQRVERKGGVVALRRVETAIKAVQRGTDRTAAELALSRLSRELSEAEEQQQYASDAAIESRESALRGRGMLTLVTLFGVVLAGLVLQAALPSSTPGFVTFLVSIVWYIAIGAAPIFVFRTTRLPPGTSSEVVRLDEAVRKLKSQIAANRAILDAPLE